MKLEKLTKEQEALMSVVRSEWIARCDDGAEIDKTTARTQIEWLYTFAKLEKPSVFFVSSPLGAQLAVALLKYLAANVRANVGDNVGDNVGANVWANVWDNVRANVGANVWDNVWANVRENVWANVWANVGENVWENVGANVGENYEAFTEAGSIYDYGWAAFYDYFARVGLTFIPEFWQFVKLLKTNIYDMIQLRRICVAAEKPYMLRRDNALRLHSTQGPAIAWRDGYELHYLHGVFFEPELWTKVTTRSLGAKELLALPNMEQRMAALKVIGVESLLKDAKCLNTSLRGNSLYLLENVFDGPAYYLRYKCPSTGREYVSGIDPEVGIEADADKAMAWKFQISPKEYQELQIEQ